MRIPTQLRSGDLGVNMTPMIDVVFLLIIFFLVATHLKKREQVQVDLAESGIASLALTDMAKAQQPVEVVINVLPGGEILLGSSRTPIEELQTRLQKHQQKTKAKLNIRIRCDRQVPYRIVAPILLACAKSEVRSVNIGVFVEKPKL